MTIVNAVPEDFGELVSIYEREGLVDEVSLVGKDARKEFAEIGTKRIIWLAKDEGITVGSIQLVLDSEKKDLANGMNRAMIHHLRVSYSHHGKRIGSKLYKTAEQKAKELGVKTLTLEVEKSNTKAKEIYEHWGFVYVGEGEDPNEVVMEKRLHI
ncbi:hypothetical protein C5B42_04215 [Candidatus Cerribacteria bacterium 'Amazon FNV 2010 28 9']|uniref:N-acetyltransferase domain-containing protein n=1 Tax=Candidatus Cerribacteria bacterium 'Amazon FNV 2010 28 9' TaxID=2081795 RepID=A0A317JS73_9BACT|nr:MAG: hypothetical protein C5B42_04215 [Candidatus Cerribacteria bacterium 'Amazon FNV 2010 28 9']